MPCTRKNLVRLTLSALLASGCATSWGAARGGSDGPAQCVQMCKSWGMQLTGMVGVGDVSRGGSGAAACVCELRRASDGSADGASTQPTSTAAVVALQHVQQTQTQQMQSH